MENPIYPPEWSNLRLELKDDDEIKKEEKNKTDKIEPVSILKNPNENIPDKLYRNFARVNDNINDLREGCKLLTEYDSVEALLPFMQTVFDGAEDLEIQQIGMDTFQIQFEIIPQLYCQELEDLGISASTWIYLVSFKFNPLLDS